MFKQSKKRLNGRGFTIVELMIALSILSVILVISTTVFIQIGRLYTKGVNAANLQNTNRTIMGDVSSAIQFSGAAPSACTPFPAPPPPTAVPITCYATAPGPSDFATGPVTVRAYAFCIGNVRYSYVLNRELGTDSAPNAIAGTPANAPTPHILWRDTINQSAACQPLDLSRSPVTWDPSSVGWDSTRPSDPSNGYEMAGNRMRLTRFNVPPPDSRGVYTIDVWMALGDSDLVQTATDGHNTCRGGAGTQFCSASDITTSVARRTH
jgi:prepilin-type N-terminal cleavage/methylation domain-containing protein